MEPGGKIRGTIEACGAGGTERVGALIGDKCAPHGSSREAHALRTTMNTHT
jgi:hypothetical protein